MGATLSKLLKQEFKDSIAKSLKSYKGLTDVDVFVLDNTLRECSIGERRSLSIDEKLEIYGEIKKCGFTDVIIGSLRHLDQDDEVFIKTLLEDGENPDGLWAFVEVTSGCVQCLTDPHTVTSSLLKVKDLGLRNIILELELSPSSQEETSTNKNLQMLNTILTWCHKELHENSKIMVSFRDLPNVVRNNPDQLVDTVLNICTLPKSLQIDGLIFEDSKGTALPEEFGQWIYYTKRILDNYEWKGYKLVHVYEMYGLSEVTTLQALMNGSDGVVASICNDGAVGSAASSVTLVNLIRLGNKKVLERYNCQYLRDAAVKITQLSSRHSPCDKQIIYGQRACDYPSSFYDPAEFDMAGFFGERQPIKINQATTPSAILNELKFNFGDSKQFNHEYAHSIKDVVVTDLRRTRKAEYVSKTGLAVLCERSGGLLTDDMKALIDTHKSAAIKEAEFEEELAARWVQAKKPTDSHKDNILSYDSFYHGFISPYMGCYYYKDTVRGLKELDVNKQGGVDWETFMIHVRWTMNKWPSVKTSDELLNKTVYSSFIPLMKGELKQKNCIYNGESTSKTSNYLYDKLMKLSQADEPDKSATSADGNIHLQIWNKPDVDKELSSNEDINHKDVSSTLFSIPSFKNHNLNFLKQDSKDENASDAVGVKARKKDSYGFSFPKLSKPEGWMDWSKSKANDPERDHLEATDVRVVNSEENIATPTSSTLSFRLPSFSSRRDSDVDAISLKSKSPEQLNKDSNKPDYNFFKFDTSLSKFSLPSFNRNKDTPETIEDFTEGQIIMETATINEGSPKEKVYDIDVSQYLTSKAPQSRKSLDFLSLPSFNFPNFHKEKSVNSEHNLLEKTEAGDLDSDALRIKSTKNIIAGDKERKWLPNISLPTISMTSWGRGQQKRNGDRDQDNEEDIEEAGNSDRIKKSFQLPTFTIPSFPGKDQGPLKGNEQDIDNDAISVKSSTNQNLKQKGGNYSWNSSLRFFDNQPTVISDLEESQTESKKSNSSWSLPSFYIPSFKKQKLDDPSLVKKDLINLEEKDEIAEMKFKENESKPQKTTWQKFSFPQFNIPKWGNSRNSKHNNETMISEDDNTEKIEYASGQNTQKSSSFNLPNFSMPSFSRKRHYSDEDEIPSWEKDIEIDSDAMSIKSKTNRSIKQKRNQSQSDNKWLPDMSLPNLNFSMPKWDQQKESKNNLKENHDDQFENDVDPSHESTQKPVDSKGYFILPKISLPGFSRKRPNEDEKNAGTSNIDWDTDAISIKAINSVKSKLDGNDKDYKSPNTFFYLKQEDGESSNQNVNKKTSSFTFSKPSFSMPSFKKQKIEDEELSNQIKDVQKDPTNEKDYSWMPNISIPTIDLSLPKWNREQNTENKSTWTKNIDWDTDAVSIKSITKSKSRLNTGKNILTEKHIDTGETLEKAEDSYFHFLKPSLNFSLPKWNKKLEDREDNNMSGDDNETISNENHVKSDSSSFSFGLPQFSMPKFSRKRSFDNSSPNLEKEVDNGDHDALAIKSKRNVKFKDLHSNMSHSNVDQDVIKESSIFSFSIPSFNTPSLKRQKLDKDNHDENEDAVRLRSRLYGDGDSSKKVHQDEKSWMSSLSFPRFSIPEWGTDREKISNSNDNQSKEESFEFPAFDESYFKTPIQDNSLSATDENTKTWLSIFDFSLPKWNNIRKSNNTEDVVNTKNDLNESSEDIENQPKSSFSLPKVSLPSFSTGSGSNKDALHIDSDQDAISIKSSSVNKSNKQLSSGFSLPSFNIPLFDREKIVGDDTKPHGPKDKTSGNDWSIPTFSMPKWGKRVSNSSVNTELDENEIKITQTSESRNFSMPSFNMPGFGNKHTEGKANITDSNDNGVNNEDTASKSYSFPKLNMPSMSLPSFQRNTSVDDHDDDVDAVSIKSKTFNKPREINENSSFKSSLRFFNPTENAEIKEINHSEKDSGKQSSYGFSIPSFTMPSFRRRKEENAEEPTIYAEDHDSRVDETVTVKSESRIFSMPKFSMPNFGNKQTEGKTNITDFNGSNVINEDTINKSYSFPKLNMPNLPLPSFKRTAYDDDQNYDDDAVSIKSKTVNKARELNRDLSFKSSSRLFNSSEHGENKDIDHSKREFSKQSYGFSFPSFNNALFNKNEKRKEEPKDIQGDDTTIDESVTVESERRIFSMPTFNVPSFGKEPKDKTLNITDMSNTNNRDDTGNKSYLPKFSIPDLSIPIFKSQGSEKDPDDDIDAISIKSKTTNKARGIRESSNFTPSLRFFDSTKKERTENESNHKVPNTDSKTNFSLPKLNISMPMWGQKGEIADDNTQLDGDQNLLVNEKIDSKTESRMFSMPTGSTANKINYNMENKSNENYKGTEDDRLYSFPSFDVPRLSLPQFGKSKSGERKYDDDDGDQDAVSIKSKTNKSKITNEDSSIKSSLRFFRTAEEADVNSSVKTESDNNSSYGFSLPTFSVPSFSKQNSDERDNKSPDEISQETTNDSKGGWSLPSLNFTLPHWNKETEEEWEISQISEDQVSWVNEGVDTSETEKSIFSMPSFSISGFRKGDKDSKSNVTRKNSKDLEEDKSKTDSTKSQSIISLPWSTLKNKQAGDRQGVYSETMQEEYMIKAESSSLFGQPSISKKSNDETDGEDSDYRNSADERSSWFSLLSWFKVSKDKKEDLDDEEYNVEKAEELLMLQRRWKHNKRIIDGQRKQMASKTDRINISEQRKSDSTMMLEKDIIESKTVFSTSKSPGEHYKRQKSVTSLMQKRIKIEDIGTKNTEDHGNYTVMKKFYIQPSDYNKIQHISDHSFSNNGEAYRDEDSIIYTSTSHLQTQTSEFEENTKQMERNPNQSYMEEEMDGMKRYMETSGNASFNKTSTIHLSPRSSKYYLAL